ncbi:MAG: hypothetical protein GY714_14815 [Desulfobacterales bacterium]|nr:hypothetical protein [Desulfobacterales bacterium]
MEYFDNDDPYLRFVDKIPKELNRAPGGDCEISIKMISPLKHLNLGVAYTSKLVPEIPGILINAKVYNHRPETINREKNRVIFFYFYFLLHIHICV